jgi:hypothetical protein
LDPVLRSLLARDLSGVMLVISDAHEGLKSATGALMVVLPSKDAEYISTETSGEGASEIGGDGGAARTASVIDHS